MADNIFKVEIITPDRIFYTGEADFIEFSAEAGDLGVYKNHIPLTTVITPGIVAIHNGEETKYAAVHAGFAQILGESVTLLAEVAEWPNEIDEERARAAKERAEERLASHDESVDVKRAELALRKSLIRMSAKDYI